MSHGAPAAGKVIVLIKAIDCTAKALSPYVVVLTDHLNPAVMYR